MIRLGILGPGRIVERVMKDMHNAKQIEVTAIASRSLEKAAAAANRYHIAHAYGSYEEMAASKEVDLVYIATPHPFHLSQAMLMMRHGKHVICEKPLAVNEKETSLMIACAKETNVFLMEAMWTRFFPATGKLRQLLSEDAIGAVRHVYGSFSYVGKLDAHDRAYAPELAGGALLDLGVYPLAEICMILGWEPDRLTGLACKAETGVDMRMSVQMGFPSGATAQFFCGMDAASPDSLTVYGTKGYLIVPNFWHPDQILVYANGSSAEVFPFDHENEGHHYEFDHAAQCIQQGLCESPEITWQESLAISRICTKLRQETGILYPMD